MNNVSVNKLIVALNNKKLMFDSFVKRHNDNYFASLSFFPFRNSYNFKTLFSSCNLNEYGSKNMSTFTYYSLFPVETNVNSSFNFTENIESMSPSLLARSVKRAAKQGYEDRLLWKKYAERAAEIANDCSISDIAIIMQGFSIRKMRDFTMFSALSLRFLNIIEENDNIDISAYDLTSFISACGRLQLSDSKLMNILVDYVTMKVSDMRPKDLANIAHAYAKMHIPIERLFHLVAYSLPPYLYDLTPIGLANVCRAFSRANIYDKALMDALVIEVRKRIKQFSAPETLNFIFGLANIQTKLDKDNKRDDKELLSAITDSLRRTLSPLGLLQHIIILECLIKLRYYDSRFIHEKLLPSIYSKYQLSSDLHIADEVRLFDCLLRLPYISGISAELFEEILTNIQRKLVFDVVLISKILRGLKNTNCFDYDIMSKSENLILNNTRIFIKTASILDVKRIYEAFNFFEESREWEEIMQFLKPLYEKASREIIAESNAVDTNSAHDKKNLKHGKREEECGNVYVHKYDCEASDVNSEKVELRGMTTRQPQDIIMEKCYENSIKSVKEDAKIKKMGILSNNNERNDVVLHVIKNGNEKKGQKAKRVADGVDSSCSNETIMNLCNSDECDESRNPNKNYFDKSLKIKLENSGRDKKNQFELEEKLVEEEEEAFSLLSKLNKQNECYFKPLKGQSQKLIELWNEEEYNTQTSAEINEKNKNDYSSDKK